MSLLRSKYIPCGMELFSSSSSNQFEYIKRMLNLCDYYVLILAGRYGEIADGDFSYTELEYNYACNNNIPVLAFLHKCPENIPIKYSETSIQKRKKLDLFRKKVESEHICNYWESPEELSVKVITSLFNEEQANPRPGWIRSINPF